MAHNEHHTVHFVHPRTKQAVAAIAVVDNLPTGFTLNAIYLDGVDVTDITNVTIVREMTLTEYLEQELATYLFGEP